MNTLSVTEAAFQKAQADRDFEIALELDRQANITVMPDAEEITNLKLALATAVSALGLIQRHRCTDATMRVVRSSYRLGCAQLGIDHD